MSDTSIPATLRQVVARRSRYQCSYCLSQEDIVGALFTVDHIIPESLGGTTTADNLCLACWDCNLAKHNRIAAVDPDGEMTPLFNPNKQRWHDHFIWQSNGLLIGGLTPTGRATVNALRLNRLPLVKARQRWIEVGWHPPPE